MYHPVSQNESAPYLHCPSVLFLLLRYWIFPRTYLYSQAGSLLIPFETLLYPVCLCLYPLLVKQLFPSVLPLLQVSVSPDSERSVLWFLPELVLPDLTLLDWLLTELFPMSQVLSELLLLESLLTVLFLLVLFLLVLFLTVLFLTVLFLTVPSPPAWI